MEANGGTPRERSKHGEKKPERSAENICSCIRVTCHSVHNRPREQMNIKKLPLPTSIHSDFLVRIDLRSNHYLQYSTELPCNQVTSDYMQKDDYVSKCRTGDTALSIRKFIPHIVASKTSSPNATIPEVDALNIYIPKTNILREKLVSLLCIDFREIRMRPTEGIISCTHWTEGS